MSLGSLATPRQLAWLPFPGKGRRRHPVSDAFVSSQTARGTLSNIYGSCGQAALSQFSTHISVMTRIRARSVRPSSPSRGVAAYVAPCSPGCPEPNTRALCVHLGRSSRYTRYLATPPCPQICAHSANKQVLLPRQCADDRTRDHPGGLPRLPLAYGFGGRCTPAAAWSLSLVPPAPTGRRPIAPTFPGSRRGPLSQYSAIDQAAGVSIHWICQDASQLTAGWLFSITDN
jgi:hypothetical protein